VTYNLCYPIFNNSKSKHIIKSNSFCKQLKFFEETVHIASFFDTCYIEFETDKFEMNLK